MKPETKEDPLKEYLGKCVEVLIVVNQYDVKSYKGELIDFDRTQIIMNSSLRGEFSLRRDRILDIRKTKEEW